MTSIAEQIDSSCIKVYEREMINGMEKTIRWALMACGIIAPVVLFLIRYYLPVKIVEAMQDPSAQQKTTSPEKVELKTEAINFPGEMMMIALGYTVPGFFQLILQNANDAWIWLCVFFVYSLILLIALPFLCAFTKKNAKFFFCLDKKVKRKSYWRITASYIVSFLFICISLATSIWGGVS